jgi:peptidoglycan/LPS O-acetylase OafA/YrhL
VRALQNNLFNGQAAVIAFFIISGFCIHFPNRRGFEMPSWAAYYLGRYIRILVPMAVAIALALPLKLKLGIFSDSILWSLLCEEIYYFLYPVLLRLRDLLGWRTLLLLASVLSLLTILTAPGAKVYPAYGPWLNWTLGLPCWLLGVHMAERLELFQARPVSIRRIWVWRAGVWAASVAASVLSFHTPIGLPWTLNLFAIFAALWLQREISYYHGATRIPVLERLGGASYSVYLTHAHAATLIKGIAESRLLSAGAFWWLIAGLTALFAMVFYWCVERPSHQFARRFSRRFAVLQRDSKASLVAN